MYHKAFVFAFDEFKYELEKPLFLALETGGLAGIFDFIYANLDLLKHPDDHDPIDETWQQKYMCEDAHQLGDIALTKFYNPEDDIGLDYSWVDVNKALSQVPHKISPVLGVPFGPKNNQFDPGKMGSYFQDTVMIESSLKSLESFRSLEHDFDALVEMLEAGRGKGLYITF